LVIDTVMFKIENSRGLAAVSRRCKADVLAFLGDGGSIAHLPSKLGAIGHPLSAVRR
jgi:hypothetical protein